MKMSDTISVNPGKTALGHVEKPASSLFRSQVLGVETKSQQLNVINLLFPATKSGLSDYRKYEVPLRTIFATILIVTGISFLTTVTGLHSAGFAICTLCFGGLLALGLFTRPAMLGAAAYYCICGALSIRYGLPDLISFCLMFGTLLFCVVGGGKYSCDTIIRSAIMRHKRKSAAEREEDCLGYKAFHKVRI